MDKEFVFHSQLWEETWSQIGALVTTPRKFVDLGLPSLLRSHFGNTKKMDPANYVVYYVSVLGKYERVTDENLRSSIQHVVASRGFSTPCTKGDVTSGKNVFGINFKPTWQLRNYRMNTKGIFVRTPNAADRIRAREAVVHPPKRNSGVQQDDDDEEEEIDEADLTAPILAAFETDFVGSKHKWIGTDGSPLRYKGKKQRKGISKAQFTKKVLGTQLYVADQYKGKAVYVMPSQKQVSGSFVQELGAMQCVACQGVVGNFGTCRGRHLQKSKASSITF